MNELAEACDTANALVKRYHSLLRRRPRPHLRVWGCINRSPRGRYVRWLHAKATFRRLADDLHMFLDQQQLHTELDRLSVDLAKLQCESVINDL